MGQAPGLGNTKAHAGREEGAQAEVANIYQHHHTIDMTIMDKVIVRTQPGRGYEATIVEFGPEHTVRVGYRDLLGRYQTQIVDQDRVVVPSAGLEEEPDYIPGYDDGEAQLETNE